MDIENIDPEKYFKVALASSVVLFGFEQNQLLIYIHQQQIQPQKTLYILPSVYVLPDKNNEQAIRKLIRDHLQIDQIYLEQLKAFAHVYRNPLGRVVNVAFYALIKLDENIKIRTKKLNGHWIPYDEIPDLAYDHNEIIDYAKERLKRRFKRRPVGFSLLPQEFTLTELQTLYEAALGKEMDKRNFRKKIFKSELIVETGNQTDPEQTRKTAKLYKFDQDKYQKMTLKGYDFLF
ncbi:MAG: NUDIX hydrolase [Flavobacteriaceae bacterium]|nr:NUDIX hydrolase [Flavobacteriaceae bacterium]